jgi:type II secretory pathway component GspD/PulD (secretin)
VNLTITPRVSFNDEIILQPPSTTAAWVRISTSPADIPTFTARTIQTTLRLRDGESNLLAGLIRQQDQNLNTGIYGLSRIPFLRNIFGNTNSVVDESDVVIIVTPHIIRSHGLTAEDLKPMYIGTGQNFGQTTPPPLISPDAPCRGHAGDEWHGCAGWRGNPRRPVARAPGSPIVQ